MAQRKRQGNPEHGYYPLPGRDTPPPVQGHPRDVAFELLLDAAEPPRDLGTAFRWTCDDGDVLNRLDPDGHDLPGDHAALLAAGSCLTCGEAYPGTGREHWIACNAESGLWELRDGAHRGNWTLG